MLKLCKTLLYPGILACICLSLSNGCDKGDRTESPPEPVAESSDSVPSPPAPPISENFDAAPQMSLFPRIADFRPEDTDTERLAYWRTFMQHVEKTSGVIQGAGRNGSRAFAIRSIKDGPSVAFFSPLAVEPSASYRVTFHLRGDLPPGGEAGIGILEYDQFLWIGQQFTESLSKEHFVRAQEGLLLSGPRDWEAHELSFTTSPKTGMIHLVFYLQGDHTRAPVLFDDISVESLPGAETAGGSEP